MAELDARILSPQIPLAANFTPIDPIAASTKAYQMQTAGAQAQTAGEQATQQGMQTASMQGDRADQDEIQKYLKSGGDLHSKEGIEKAVRALQGRVTPQTYMKLNEYNATFNEKQAEVAAKLARLQDDQFARFSQATETAGKILDPSLRLFDQTWRNDLKKTNPDLDPDENPNDPDVLAAKERAKPAYAASTRAHAKMISEMHGGKPPPHLGPVLEHLTNGDPDSGRAAWNATKAARELEKHATEMRLKTEQANREAARTMQILAGGPDQVARARFQDIIDDPTSTPAQIAMASRGIAQLDAKGGGRNRVELGYGPDTTYSELPEHKKKAVQAAAAGVMMGSPMPTAKNPLHNQINEYFNLLGEALGKSPADMAAARVITQRSSQALVSTLRRQQNVDRAITVFIAETGILLPSLEKVINARPEMLKTILPTSFPRVEAAMQWIQNEIGGRNVGSLHTNMDVVLTELEAIIRANPGAQMPVEAMRKVREDYTKINTVQNAKDWIENARGVMDRAKGATAEVIKEEQGKMLEIYGLKPGQPFPDVSKFAAPSGASSGGTGAPVSAPRAASSAPAAPSAAAPTGTPAGALATEMAAQREQLARLQALPDSPEKEKRIKDTQNSIGMLEQEMRGKPATSGLANPDPNKPSVTPPLVGTGPAPAAPPAAGPAPKIGETRPVATGDYAGRTATWDGKGWNVPDKIGDKRVHREGPYKGMTSVFTKDGVWELRD